MLSFSLLYLYIILLYASGVNAHRGEIVLSSSRVSFMVFLRVPFLLYHDLILWIWNSCFTASLAEGFRSIVFRFARAYVSERPALVVYHKVHRYRHHFDILYDLVASVEVADILFECDVVSVAAIKTQMARSSNPGKF